MNASDKLHALALRLSASGWIEASAVTAKKFEFKFTPAGKERIALLTGLFHDLEGLTPDELDTLFVFCQTLREDATRSRRGK